MQAFLTGVMNIGDASSLWQTFPDLVITHNFEEVNAMAKQGDLEALVVAGIPWNHPRPWEEVPYSWSNTIPEQVATDIHEVSPSTRILVWTHKLYRNRVEGITYLNDFAFESIYPVTESFLSGSLPAECVRTGSF